MLGESENPAAVRTACPYCGVGCGVIARRNADETWSVTGDPDHPANFGRLCSKGSALGETLSLDDRLLRPMVGGRAVSWDDALDTVAGHLERTLRNHGPDAVAFYLSGQLLTEDYYVANKLMKGFVGSSNVDTNSRLCMASSVAGHKRAFGADLVPQSYEDLDVADLVVLAGSNAAWCHPVLFQRIEANRRLRGAKVVVIDPRRTTTADTANLHLAIRPGADVALFNGLLAWLADRGVLDRPYIDLFTEGFADAVATARRGAGSIATVARATGLTESEIQRFYELFAAAPRTVTCYSQGVHQSVNGTDGVNAIINCHLATGRVGKFGAGPLSLTGQPNAMGGREVGGLANTLAAHMDFCPETIDRVRRFWNAPNMATHPGLKAVDMFDAIERGEIRFLWIMATNPAVSLPRADAVRRALGGLDLLVVSDNVASNDTLSFADVKLPAAAWGEKDGTVTNSERRISRQRPFLPLPGEAKPDWWIVAEVARRLGFGTAFDYPSPAAVFREHAALSAFENGGARAFDIGGLADLGDAAYDALQPVQWPLPAGQSAGRKRFFDGGGFFTPNRLARFVPLATPEVPETENSFPFILNTGRVRDQWHTMTRSGKSETLGQHTVEPFVEVHPSDAHSRRLPDGGLARIESTYGSAVVRVVVSRAQKRGTLFAPIHWSAENASAGRIGALVHPVTDPHSGQPDAKRTRVAIAPLDAAYYGFILSRGPIAMPHMLYWARTRIGQGWGYSVALDGASDRNWNEWTAALLDADPAELIELDDRAGSSYRAALVRDGRLDACGFFSTGADLPSWEWLKRQFLIDELDGRARETLLAGRAADGTDPGRTVCACYAVGLNEIVATIRERRLTSVEAVGAALKAGTNCGSCQPEIHRILSDVSVPAPA